MPNPQLVLRKLLLLLCACAFTLLTACGTKGPLYIPEQRYPQAVPKKPASEQPEQPADSSDKK